MKKYFFRKIFAGLASAAFLLCGCTNPIAQSSGISPGGVDKLYTAICDITVEGDDEASEALAYSGNICRLGGGFWELSLTEPETVAGLKISMGPEGIGASLGDLNFNLETDKIPSRAAFMKIFSVMDNAAASVNDLKLSENETNLCYSGSCGGEKYTLLCDKAQNMPCGLIIGRINVVFTSFTVTGEPPETSVTSSGTVTGTTAATTVTTTVTTTAPVTESSSMPSVTLVPPASETTSVTTTAVSETTTTASQTTAPVTMTSPIFTTTTATVSPAN